MTKLTESMKICIKSGDRLLEDAENLQIFKRYASVYALIKLAQEEYAKCFILKLVEAGVLKLTKEVRRSLNHHISKQLMLLILEYINPNTNEFLRKINSKTCFKISPRAVDAINIYIYEILHKWETQSWFWVDKPKYNKKAQNIYKGKDEEIKQNSLYIKILEDGSAIDFTRSFTNKIVKREIERAKRYRSFLNQNVNNIWYEQIIAAFRIINKI